MKRRAFIRTGSLIGAAGAAGALGVGLSRDRVGREAAPGIASGTGFGTGSGVEPDLVLRRATVFDGTGAPGLELDVRLRTKGTLPVVGDIVAAVSDALFQVEVTGPIGDPKARFVALPGITGSSQGQSTRPPSAQASAE